jgi:hypothetical protein
LKNLFFGVLHQAVRAVSENRPKYPTLDIPFKNQIIQIIQNGDFWGKNRRFLANLGNIETQIFGFFL